VLGSGRPLVNREEESVWPDGHRRWIVVSRLPLIDEGGTVVGTLGLARDVTDKKRQEEELRAAMEAAEAAARAKSEFLANVSHEIRTPLNGILGMTELALGTPLDDVQRDYLDTARSSTHDLLAVINDLLDFAKIEAGRLDPCPGELDLRAELAE